MFSLTSWERGNAASLFDRIQEEGSLASTLTLSLYCLMTGKVK